MYLVNDAPALKRADVGIAVGSGTESAKESAEIIILDDNFQSIKDAILYGRTIYHNILKFCLFQLTINVTAIVVSAVAPFFGIEEPLKVTHLLFVNLVMDSLGSIMLGNEPAFEKYMKEKPRRRDESIISKKMATQIGTMAAWLIIVSFAYLKLPFFAGFFGNEEQHLTGYFVLFIAAALFNGFNVRDEKFGILKGLDQNTGFLKVFFGILIIQAIIVNAGLIPSYMLIKKLGMLNSYAVYIIPNLVDIFNFILVRTYINGLPDSFVESARIDGANNVQVLFKICIPLIKPIIIL